VPLARISATCRIGSAHEELPSQALDARPAEARHTNEVVDALERAPALPLHDNRLRAYGADAGQRLEVNDRGSVEWDR
jgi:hypothetical protein